MSTSAPEPPPVPGPRPVIVDILRAYEGALVGLVIVVLAGILSAAGTGLAEFAAVVALPGLLMVVFMHLGSPPRRLFVLRSAGALVGWGLGWAVFIPLLIVLSYAVFSAPSWPLVYITIAAVDGILVALCITAADRLGSRLGLRGSAGA